jgi:hypothetical protein
MSSNDLLVEERDAKFRDWQLKKSLRDKAFEYLSLLDTKRAVDPVKLRQVAVSLQAVDKLLGIYLSNYLFNYLTIYLSISLVFYFCFTLFILLYPMLRINLFCLFYYYCILKGNNELKNESQAKQLSDTGKTHLLYLITYLSLITTIL